MLFNLSTATLFALSLLTATSVVADAHLHTAAQMKRSQELAKQRITERSTLPRAVPVQKMGRRRRSGPDRLNANSGGRGGPGNGNGGGGGGPSNGSGSSQSTSLSGGSGAGVDVSVSVGVGSGATATTSQAAAASSSASSSSSSSSSSYSGKATYFYQEGGTGACGSVNVDSAKIVALQSALYSSSYCGKTVVITNTANGESVTATVADECPGCSSEYSLDLSTGAFDAIGDEDTGVLDITWYFTD